MVFIPAGMNHCPLKLNRVDKPIFHFSVVTGSSYIQQEKAVKPSVPRPGLSRHIVTTLQIPEHRKKTQKEYTKYASQILWLDKDVVPGAFNMNTAWYLKAARTLEDKPHTHTSAGR
jgi:hypothetical protein